VQFLEGWSNRAFNTMMKWVTMVELRNDELIYQIDDKLDYIYIILEGEVTVGTNK